MQQQTFNQQERESAQSISRATPPGQSFDRAMAVDQGEQAQREVEPVAAAAAAADKATASPPLQVVPDSHATPTRLCAATE